MSKRYLIYVDNKKKRYVPEDYKDVLKQTRSLLQIYSSIEVREVRVSSYFIEIDVIFHNFKQDLFLNSIYSGLAPLGPILYCDDLSEPKHYQTNECVIENAIFLFNMERFWKSHEVLEDLWKNSSGPEKRILNGIILIDAAFVHYQKNELDVFVSISKRSLEKLQAGSGMFYGLDIDQIKESITRAISDAVRSPIFKILLC